MAKGKTAKYYANNPKAAAKRRKQQARYNKTKKGLKIRTAANKLNRKLGTSVMVMAKILVIPKKVTVLVTLKLTVAKKESTHDTFPYS